MYRSARFYKNLFILIGLILLFFLVQWMVGLFRQAGQMGLLESQTMKMTVHPPEGVMPVETETISSLQPFDSSVSYTGSAVAYNDVPIYPPIQGWIVSMNVYPGDRVKRGQLLAQLDSRELTSRVNEAQFAKQAASQSYNAAISTRNQSKAQALKAQQGIQSAHANLAYWQNEINRARSLTHDEVITMEELQREQSQFEAAQAQYNQALSEFRAAQEGTSAALSQAAAQHAQTRQAGATLRTQEIIRGYTRITAPLDGIITERTLPKGTLVSPEMQILRMAQIHPIRIQASVAQKDWEQMRIGNRVQVWESKEQNSPPVEATVTAIFPVANIQSRTAIVEAVIPNRNEHFIPGDYIRMSIITGHRKSALSVPNTAIVSINRQQAVWIQENHKATLKYVTTGDANGTRTEIVTGLKKGEIVITQGNKDLQAGMPVVSAQYGPEGLRVLPKEVASNRLNAANGYKVTYPVEDLKVTVEMLRKPPVAGNNPVSFTFAAIPMGDMKMLVPSDLELEVKTVMPAMATMPSPKPSLQKVRRERFKGTVNFSMPGLWQMETVIKVKGKMIAAPTFEVEVPE